jgi:DNA modification methylase
MNLIATGDCRDLMRRWIGEGVRVHTCVTSPPYWGLRDYGVDGQLGLEPVLAPFMGSGTTAQVALNLGRRYLGCELNPDYAKLQENRVRQMGMAL